MGVSERARAGEQRVAGVGVTRLGVEAQCCALIGVGAPRFVEWIDQTRRGWVVLHRFIRGGGDEVGAEPQTERVHKKHRPEEAAASEGDAPLILRRMAFGFA